MIKINGEIVNINHFPDRTLLLKHEETKNYEDKIPTSTIEWRFENNEELVAVIFLAKHMRNLGVEYLVLSMPYIPNARQDRVKKNEDVFTLKYFTEIINSLNFDEVRVLDPHSYVSEALINNVRVITPEKYVHSALYKLGDKRNVLMFYPDEGAMKRYSGMVSRPYAFGIKKRDWETGQIKGLDVAGDVEAVKNSTILIVDDICSRGGTFYHSAKKLKELGAKEVYLYITHCEDTILEGELLSSGLIEKVYTTNSIFTKEHEKVEVIEI